MTPKPVTSKLAAIAITVTGLAVIGTALWFTNRPAPALAKAGDCVTVPAGGKFQTVGCGDAAAKFKVLQVFGGTDGNQCEQATGTVGAVLETDGSKQSILCLGARS